MNENPAGTYTGKFKTGERVKTLPGVYPIIYTGTVTEINTTRAENNAYGVKLDVDDHETYFSEEDLEQE